MELVIDIGNTSTKMALFNNYQLKKHFVFEGLISVKDFKLVVAKLVIKEVIISSVRSDSSAFENFITRNFKTINLSSLHNLKLPFKNLYKSPATLGRDRIANAAAAVNHFKAKNVLVVDAGTCLKFDFTDAKGNYIGGSIAPGLLMRFKAVHEYTGKLPLIKPEKSNLLIGRTTEESIRTGVQQGMINEINQTIANYKKHYRSINIILTGGDLRLFAEHLKKPIFADPFLTLKGLHLILDYNT